VVSARRRRRVKPDAALAPSKGTNEGEQVPASAIGHYLNPRRGSVMHDLERIMWSTIPFAIPIIAIVGAMTVAILRVTGQQRLAELERRERIAAIERGVDPSKLPPMSSPDSYSNGNGVGSRTRRAHGLMIGGLVLLAVGTSMMVFLWSVEPNKSVWALGLMPFLIGIALLISAKVIWPASDGK